MLFRIFDAYFNKGLTGAETVFFYMQARYYELVIGRFYSNNLIGYVISNPVMSFNKLTGHSSQILNKTLI